VFSAKRKPGITLTTSNRLMLNFYDQLNKSSDLLLINLMARI
jgi:hypothetical protein